jgi:pimeloyl-ACP methyl ester carboxylesterase
VQSFVFVGSFACYPDAQAYVRNIVTAVEAAGSMEVFARERAARIGMPPGRRTDETIAQMACKSIESYKASTYATWTGDYRSVLETIAVPTLVICGANDAIAPPDLSREIAAGIPGARLEIVADAGHVTNADQPARFNELLRTFYRTRLGSE